MKKMCILFIMTLILLVGCSSPSEKAATVEETGAATPEAGATQAPEDEASQSKKETSKKKADKGSSNAENMSGGKLAKGLTKKQKEKRKDNASAKLTTLNPGSYKVGLDIPPGRYAITGNGTGNFLVFNGKNPIANEILSDDDGFGVKKITLDLRKKQKIRIEGLNNVTFTPAKTKRSNTLSTGTWIVGLDIKAGSYTATCDKGDTGNLIVYDGDVPRVNEILDRSGMDIGVKKVKLKLSDGETIAISKLSSVTFQ